MTKKRLAAIDKDIENHGIRRDLSRTAIRRTLARAKNLTGDLTRIQIDTDQKKIDPQVIGEAFGDLATTQVQTSSKLMRDVRNPLFPINQTEGLARDVTSRLRRESWLTSKRRRWMSACMYSSPTGTWCGGGLTGTRLRLLRNWVGCEGVCGRQKCLGGAKCLANGASTHWLAKPNRLKVP